MFNTLTKNAFTGTLEKAQIKRTKEGSTVAQLVITAPATDALLKLIRLSTGGTLMIEMDMLQEPLPLAQASPADTHVDAHDPEEEDEDEEDEDLDDDDEDLEDEEEGDPEDESGDLAIVESAP